MSLNLSLVIVPQWVRAAMQAKGMAMNRVLDLMALSRILSKRDVSFYISIYTRQFEKLPDPLKKTFDYYEYLYREKDRVITEDGFGNTPSPADVQKFYREMSCLTWSRDEIGIQFPEAASLVSLLPHGADDSQSYDINTNLVFDIYPITETVYGISFTPADPSRPFMEQITECYDKLLGQLCGIHGLQAIADTPAFQHYVQLSRQHL